MTLKNIVTLKSCLGVTHPANLSTICTSLKSWTRKAVGYQFNTDIRLDRGKRDLAYLFASNVDLWRADQTQRVDVIATRCRLGVNGQLSLNLCVQRRRETYRCSRHQRSVWFIATAEWPNLGPPTSRVRTANSQTKVLQHLGDSRTMGIRPRWDVSCCFMRILGEGIKWDQLLYLVEILSFLLWDLYLKCRQIFGCSRRS